MAVNFRDCPSFYLLGFVSFMKKRKFNQLKSQYEYFQDVAHILEFEIGDIIYLCNSLNNTEPGPIDS